MSATRLAQLNDLEALLALFRASDVSPIAKDPAPIWRAILADARMRVFVCSKGSILVATASLIKAPNLLRQGRSHGFLENVMIHPEHQGRGYGRAVVRAALAAAWEADCHHVLLQSGRADPRVHSFYRSLGFEPGVREAYVARAPSAK